MTSELRNVAFSGMGYSDYDDSAAFPCARAAMVPQGRQVTKTFLANREEILAYYGAYLFQEDTIAERRVKMKVITNAYDMDAAENMWVKKYGNPHKRSLGGKIMKLTNGQNFSMDAYREAQGNGTNWMVSRSPSMMDFINQMVIKKKKKGNRKLMAKSYLLQEAEAVSRETKIKWAVERGIPVASLQHDGILLCTGENPHPDIGTHLAHTASIACGYQVTVKGKKL